MSARDPEEQHQYAPERQEPPDQHQPDYDDGRKTARRGSLHFRTGTAWPVPHPTGRRLIIFNLGGSRLSGWHQPCWRSSKRSSDRGRSFFVAGGSEPAPPGQRSLLRSSCISPSFPASLRTRSACHSSNRCQRSPWDRPQEWLTFLLVPHSSPVYLFVDDLQDQHIGPFYQPQAGDSVLVFCHANGIPACRKIALRAFAASANRSGPVKPNDFSATTRCGSRTQKPS